MQRSLFYMAGIVLLSSCVVKNVNSTDSIRAFDISGWIDSTLQIQSVSSTLRFSKTVSLDDKTESTMITYSEFDSSLQIMKGMDLNNPMYEGRVLVDTTYQSDSVYTVLYTTTSDKVPVRACTIQFEKRDATSIHIITEENNLLYKIHKEYTYIPETLFTVAVTQRTIFYGEKKYQLQYSIE